MRGRERKIEQVGEREGDIERDKERERERGIDRYLHCLLDVHCLMCFSR